MNWQEQIVDAVQATTERTRKEGPRGVEWTALLLRIHPDMHKALHDVAAGRGLSMASYWRRLLAMALAKETGQPLAAWLDRIPAPTGPDNSHIAALRNIHTHDDGTGMEGMCPHPGCDVAHW